jgi:mono/diheme cytochrome c family protein
MRPQDELFFDRLYSQNCSACHGETGQGGPALDLENPEFQALVDDATLKRWITGGMPGTQMPAFGESAGGMLTSQQVEALVEGMRKSWAAAKDDRSNAPPYNSQVSGDVSRGNQLYQTACLRCHQQKHQQTTDTTFLALLSDQALRTIIIAGRPDLGHPGWRGAVPGHPFSDQDVTDIVSYLGSRRTETPGQPYPERKTER